MPTDQPDKNNPQKPRQSDRPLEQPTESIALDTAVRIPNKIGHYHAKRVLASGGMGTVYEATQEKPPVNLLEVETADQTFWAPMVDAGSGDHGRAQRDLCMAYGHPERHDSATRADRHGQARTDRTIQLRRIGCVFM